MFLLISVSMSVSLRADQGRAGKIREGEAKPQHEGQVQGRGKLASERDRRPTTRQGSAPSQTKQRKKQTNC